MLIKYVRFDLPQKIYKHIYILTIIRSIFLSKIQTKDLVTFQFKAARRALDISLRDLSKEINVDINALSRLESCDLDSIPQKSHFRTIARLRSFLESQGIEFLDNGGIRYIQQKEPEIIFRMKE